MDQFDRSRNHIQQSPASFAPPFLPPNQQRLNRSEDIQQQRSEPPPASNMMRGAKRKRLAKACDACHKSKRRCDGTAPCSNCYFASKQCTYTDASGRPVPAPHRFDQARDNLLGPPPSDNRAAVTFNHPPPQPSLSAEPSRLSYLHRPPYSSSILSSAPNLGNDSNDDERKRKRLKFAPEDLIIDGPITGISMDRPAPVELDHSLTRELTNLFFTHCHPARAIIHKPTFSANLSHNCVPLYLLHAVCALAAPLSKQPRIRTNPARFAGKPFAQEALSLMFDGAGRLVCEPNLAAAQALCLLQMHDIVTKESNLPWGSKYHDLALQIVEALGVHSPEHPTLTPLPSPEFISASLEREAIRRIFWYIHLIDLKASIYFKKPITFTEAELRLRLPVDETSFELGVHSTLPEYLYLPAVRTQNASEFGHLVRIMTIFAKVEQIIDELNVPYRDPESLAATTKSLKDAEQHMENWARTLPDHLRFSEQSLLVQQSMFETSSNTGAWCWCCLHVYHASCALALNYAKQRNQRDAKVEPLWAITMIDSILKMTGDRAKNSFLLGVALWTLIKYCKRDDPQMRGWCADYEESFGSKMFELVREWQDWQPQPSPPQRHQYAQPPQPSQQPLQRPSHRITDGRHPVNPSSSSSMLPGRPPPLQHGGDVSHSNRRSPSESPNLNPGSYLRGRYGDEGAPSSNSGTNATTRLSSLNLSDNRDNWTGNNPPPTSVPLSVGSYPVSNDQKYSIKPEIDSSILRNEESVGDAQDGSSSGQPIRRSPPIPNNSSSSRNTSFGGENITSLPSLKASGLLDWNNGPRAVDVQKQAHGPNGTQPRPSPRKSSPHQSVDETRSTLPALTMPVGLPWLANETR